MFRRDFIKNIGLLGAAVSVPVGVVNAVDKNDDPTTIGVAEIVLKGQVLGQGQGVAGVSVTDGINVTRTDTKGNYRLLSNKTAQFVYISIPSGFQIANENGIARFYVPVDKKEKSFTTNFNLVKLEQPDIKHQFAVWADPQIQNKKDADLLLTTTAPDLRELVKSYGDSALFHGICCGDLVFDKHELFADYKQAVAVAGIPFFQVLGNHDMDFVDVRSDEQSTETFKSIFGPTYYSFNRGKVHYVVLDNVFSIGAGKRYIGYLTEAQLSWLEQDLAYVSKDTLVIVTMHIPSDSGEKSRLGLKEESISGVLSNRKQLYKILEPFNAHIISGHTHWNENLVISDRLMEHNLGTACGAWWSGPCCGDGTPNGYGIFEVDETRLTWFYKSTGKNKNHQFCVYEKGYHKSYPDHVLVNVWNWDEKWKVEWLEDGAEKGEMERIADFDPQTLELYQGSTLPAYRKWVEPIKTEHLFMLKPSTSAKLIMIRVRDRFGNVYTEAKVLS
ncbi:calcineurin-like phosphoesterase C-terminal domain-containing protein [Solitalea lacus]|uniref:calcineurin-like phosphoesterase C-terminal domain-containing protein n=1 Tax=Solitalea lacus TaxID=2911172 RepID=UPI001EDBB5E4|nr:calcineurin-like phosphoesterase family protein [Solitalea lacus]UKJ07773.1 calcineurin-like phosphoesterase family protein [Solitalea lacus]